MITPEELDYIRTAAIGDMLGDSKALDEMDARQARLEAERDGAARVVFPAALRRRDEPEVAQAMTSEQRLFELRRAAREGQKAQLREQIEQLRQQIAGSGRT